MTTTGRKFSLDQQIEEIDREIKLRIDVYARWIASGKMRQSVADFHMDRIRAVKDTLHWLKLNEAAIRATIKELKPGGKDGDSNSDGEADDGQGYDQSGRPAEEGPADEGEGPQSGSRPA